MCALVLNTSTAYLQQTWHTDDECVLQSSSRFRLEHSNLIPLMSGQHTVCCQLRDDAQLAIVLFLVGVNVLLPYGLFGDIVRLCCFPGHVEALLADEPELVHQVVFACQHRLLGPLFERACALARRQESAMLAVKLHHAWMSLQAWHGIPDGHIW